ncbi:MAG: hypothetical protein ABIO91_04820 [Pyrinomonadaceae bacterium]
MAGCGLWRSNENSSLTFASQPKSEYPFLAREPAVFQAELVIRTGEIQRRIFIARSGERRRIDYDLGTDNQHGVILADKEYVMFFKRKVFEEHDMSSSAAALYEPLSAQMLSTRDYASFAEISREGSVVEYRARFNESSNSEALIFFDETIGLPIKQEFYSIGGEERKLQYSVELKDFRAQAEPELFEVPKNLRRQERRE